MNLNMMFWAQAWGAYHTQNYGVASHLLGKIDLSLESEEWIEEFNLFREMLDEHLEGDNENPN